MKTTILVPVLNEIVGLKHVMPQVKREWYDQILVVDGGSKDGSVEYALEQGYEVVRQTRPGMRSGYLEAFPQIRGDVVVCFGPDGNSVVEDIPRLLDKMREGYDMVIASRYKDWAHSDDDTALSAVGNAAFTKVISLFGHPYTDAMVQYRAWKKDLPVRLGLTNPRSPFWEAHVGRYVSWEPQLSIRCAKIGARVAEIPSNEPKRVDQAGSGVLLPASRIRHFRVGFACLMQVVEEAITTR